MDCHHIVPHLYRVVFYWSHVLETRHDNSLIYWNMYARLEPCLTDSEKTRIEPLSLADKNFAENPNVVFCLIIVYN